MAFGKVRADGGDVAAPDARETSVRGRDSGGEGARELVEGSGARGSSPERGAAFGSLGRSQVSCGFHQLGWVGLGWVGLATWRAVGDRESDGQEIFLGAIG